MFRHHVHLLHPTSAIVHGLEMLLQTVLVSGRVEAADQDGSGLVHQGHRQQAVIEGFVLAHALHLPHIWERLIIIIAFKGAIRDFLQSPHSAANCLHHVRSSGPGATVCKSRATHRALITCKCHVTCHLVRRDSSAIKFDRVEIAFI